MRYPLRSDWLLSHSATNSETVAEITFQPAEQLWYVFFNEIPCFFPVFDFVFVPPYVGLDCVQEFERCPMKFSRKLLNLFSGFIGEKKLPGFKVLLKVSVRGCDNFPSFFKCGRILNAHWMNVTGYGISKRNELPVGFGNYLGLGFKDFRIPNVVFICRDLQVSFQPLQCRICFGADLGFVCLQSNVVLMLDSCFNPKSNDCGYST